MFLMSPNEVTNMSQFSDLIQGSISSSTHAGHLLQGKMHNVLVAVCNAGEKGITTRQVAEHCDLSVYAARNWLMKLEGEGHIHKIYRPRNTTWHLI
jgi:ribosomal protein S25